MPTADDRAHTNRRRAESFGTVAEAYDRARPSYPPALIDDLAALHPADVLDIGCGTGKAATLLAARGLSVLGVEIDPRMAEIARRHGLPVEVGSFEEWDPAGRRVDLITCGQAWHWIDAAVGAPKAAAVLRPGGTLALFWNFASLDHPTRYALDRVYDSVAAELSPQSVVRGGGPATLGSHGAALAAAGFAPVEHRQYEWSQRYTRQQWLAMLGTHSDHTTLPPDQLEELLSALGAAIDSLGGSVLARYRTEALFATAPAGSGVAG